MRSSVQSQPNQNLHWGGLKTKILRTGLYQPWDGVKLSDPQHFLVTLKYAIPDRNAAEMQICDKQKQINYDTKQYRVAILGQKYMEGINVRTNNLIIPDSQRKIVWDDERQSKFI